MRFAMIALLLSAGPAAAMAVDYSAGDAVNPGAQTCSESCGVGYAGTTSGGYIDVPLFGSAGALNSDWDTAIWTSEAVYAPLFGNPDATLSLTIGGETRDVHLVSTNTGSPWFLAFDADWNPGTDAVATMLLNFDQGAVALSLTKQLIGWNDQFSITGRWIATGGAEPILNNLTTTPLPGSAGLFLAGLAGLALLSWRRRKAR